MKAFKFYISLFFFVSIFSCKPEELPPPENETPVFSVSGDLVDITAGENDFYLFTNYEKDGSDVYSFSGRFAKTSDCSADCKEELLIEFRDAQQTSGTGGVDIDNALKVGNYSYKVLNPSVSNDSVVLSFTAEEPEGTGPFIYIWAIELDTTLAFATQEVTFTFENSTNLASVNACLETQSANNCQIEYCNDIFLNTNAPGCQADFSIINDTPAFFELGAEMENGIPPFSYAWNTNDLTQTITQTVNGPFNGTYCVTITDGSGCFDEICKNIEISQGGSAPIVCSSRFSYQKAIQPGGGDSLQLNTVFIQYTDNQGNVYRSDAQPQPNTNSYFEIISIEEYELNEKGDKTKKMFVSANCVLYDANGGMKIFPFEGVIAVAYP